MYIYNVTTNIEESVHDDWLHWMKEVHIPEVLATGKFLNAKMCKVLVEEDMGGVTYSVQFTTVDKETLERYYTEDAPKLRKDVLSRFANKFVSFRTELKVVDEQLNQSPIATHYVFAYGTLQEKDIQLSVFSRTMAGEDEQLEAYTISATKVAGQYPTVCYTGNTRDVLSGKVYILTPQELEKADMYEGEAYQRVQVTLVSGKKAWLYMAK